MSFMLLRIALPRLFETRSKSSTGTFILIPDTSLTSPRQPNIDATKARCSFMSLSAELRNRIYDLALHPQLGEGGVPDTTAIFIGRQTHLPHDLSPSRTNQLDFHPTAWARQPSLLMVSKQIRAEGLEMFYGTNHFVVCSKFVSSAPKSPISALYDPRSSSGWRTFAPRMAPPSIHPHGQPSYVPPQGPPPPTVHHSVSHHIQPQGPFNMNALGPYQPTPPPGPPSVAPHNLHLGTQPHAAPGPPSLPVFNPMSRHGPTFGHSSYGRNLSISRPCNELTLDGAEEWLRAIGSANAALIKTIEVCHPKSSEPVRSPSWAPRLLEEKAQIIRRFSSLLVPSTTTTNVLVIERFSNCGPRWVVLDQEYVEGLREHDSAMGRVLSRGPEAGSMAFRAVAYVGRSTTLLGSLYADM